MIWTRKAPGLHVGWKPYGAKARIEYAGFEYEWIASLWGRVRKGRERTVSACKHAVEQWVTDMREKRGES